MLIASPALPVITRDDAGYDDARRAWNLAVDQRPAAVATPESADDVVAAVAYAREHGLRVAAQGTGHNAGALGDLDDVLLVKTHRMRGVEVDGPNRVCRVEAGALWGDVIGPVADAGLMCLHGSSHDVGVVGYTLGGGVSFYGRRYGTAASRTLAFEVVTADGELIRADRSQNTDLFHAMKGGGGAFGIVVALEFELFDFGEIQAGHLWFPLERGREVFHAWREWTLTLPTTAASVARIMRVPDIDMAPPHLRGQEFAIVETIVLGTPEEADALLAPIRELGPSMDTHSTQDFRNMVYLHMDPPGPVPGAGDHQILGELTAETVDTLFDNLPDTLLGYQIIHAGEALSEIGGPFLTFGGGMAATPEMKAAVRAGLAELRKAMAPWSNGREYLNFSEESGGDPARLWDHDTYARLLRVKADVDPDGLIVSNHPVA